VSELFLLNIIEICEFLFTARSIMLGMFFRFSFILTHISHDLLSLGSTEAYIG